MGNSGQEPRQSRKTRLATVESTAALDEIDAAILQELQNDARLNYSELGRRVRLSPAAVTERVRRLESEGVILGYGARVSPRRLGYGLRAFVRVDPHSGFTLRHPRVERFAAAPEVMEAHHVVGEDCWIVKVTVADAEHLEALLAELSSFGRTTTSVVLSSPVEAKPLPPLRREAEDVSGLLPTRGYRGYQPVR